MFKNLPSRGLRTLFLCLIVFVFGSGKLAAQNNALTFDGTDDYVSVSDDPSNNFGAASEAFTVEFWVQSASDVGDLTMVNKGGGSGNEQYSFDLFSGGNTRFYVQDVAGGGGASFTILTAPRIVIADGWTHVAGVFDGANTTLELYINGELVDSNTSAPAQLFATSNIFTIGAQATPASYFNGQIDEVRIWNEARKAEDIRASAAGTISASETGLVAYYKLDEAGNEIDIADATGTIDGTLNGKTGLEIANGWVASTAFDNPKPVIKIFGSDDKNPLTSGNIASIAEGTDFSHVIFTDPSVSKVFTIENHGVGQLNSISVSAGSAPLISSTASTAGTLEPGTSTAFSITYDPSSTGLNSQAFTISSNSSIDPSFTLNTQGTGVNNNALNFDGSDDQVTIGTFGALTTTGTIEFWMNATDISSNAGLFDSDLTDANNGFRLEINPTAGLIFVIDDAGSPSVYNLFAGGGDDIAASTWYHIAVTWDTGTDAIIGYVDGVEKFNSTFAGTWPDMSDFALGVDLDAGSGRWFNGTMDEFRIWDIVRSPTQISNNMNVYAMSVDEGLVASYDFNIGTGSADNTGIGEPSLTDITANTNDGTLSGTFAKNGATSNYLTSTVGAAATPEIEVISPLLANLVDGDPVSAGDTGYGYIGAAGYAKTFTINNTGLAGLSVTNIDASGDWSVINASETLPVNIPASGSMTFEVLAGTNLTQVITIYSNDGDEEDFDINTSITAVVENALDFDGTDDEVEIPFSNSGMEAYTMEMWVNFPSLNAARAIAFLTNDGNEDAQYSQSTYITAGNQISHYIWDGAAAFTVTGNETLVADEWYHIAVTGSLDEDELSIYINGQLDNTLDITSAIAFDAMDELNLGRASTGLSLSAFDGQMDEFRYWDEARTEAQIAANLGNSIREAEGLVASYDFDNAGNGTTLLRDITGNGLDGTIDPESDGATSGFDLDGTDWVPSTALDAAQSELEVFVDGLTPITNGAVTVSTAEGTQFGEVSETRTARQTFYMNNLGINNLEVSSISGDAVFDIQNQPAFPASLGQESFDVEYIPNSALDNATVSIANNAQVGTTPFTFEVEGSAVQDLALDFDGVDDYVTIDTHVDFDNNAFTIEGWFKLSDLDKQYNYLITRGNWAGGVDQYAMFVENDILRLAIHNGVGWQYADGGTTLVENVWYHLAATFDGAELKVYINGAEDGTTSFSYVLGTPGLDITLGGIISGIADTPLNGQMDEVRIWNEPRDAASIQSTMYTSLIGTESGLVAYYSFDNTAATPLVDNSGQTTLVDKTGNHNGTLSQAPGFDLGATNNGTTNYRNTSNWVYSGAIAPQIHVENAADATTVYSSSDAANIVSVTGAVGQTTVLTFNVYNTSGELMNLTLNTPAAGAGDAEINNVQIDGVSSAIVLPGMFTTVTVDFTPGTPGVYNNDISFATNDPDNPTFTFNVEGTSLRGPAGITDGIVTWLRGEDGATGSWVDYSGAGLDFITTGNDPGVSSTAIGYQAGLTFDGTQYLEANASSSLDAGPYTKIVVVRAAANASNTYMLGSSTASEHALAIDGGTGFPVIRHAGANQAIGDVDESNNVLLLTAVYEGSSGPTRIFTYGGNEKFVGSSSAYSDAGNIQLGADNSLDGIMGEIAEVIIYDRILTTNERKYIDSYLALKYGINLADANNYVLTDDTPLIAPVVGTYSNGIIAVGRDDASAIDVRQSYNADEGQLLTIGAGEIAVDHASNLTTIADQSFIVMGHNDVAMDYGSIVTTQLPGGVSARMGRVYMVQEELNDITDVDINVDFFATNGWPAGTASNYVMMIHSDPSDWTGATPVAASSLAAGIATFEGVDISDNSFLTFAFSSAQASDIVTSYTVPATVDFSGNVGANVDDPEGVGIGALVGEFTIQDGGGVDDGDGLGTTLDAITLQFNLTNTEIASVALYDATGATEYDEVTLTGGGNNEAVFTTGLSGDNITAADDANPFTFRVYVVFNDIAAYTDRSLSVGATITSAAALGSGSGFADADAGGAFIDISGSENALDVIATKLTFTSGPGGNVATGASFDVEVSALDDYDNLDINNTTSVTVSETSTPTGTLSGGTATALTAGVHTFSLSYSAAHSLNIDAQGAGLTDADYNTDQLANINVVDPSAISTLAANTSESALNPGTAISEGTATSVFSFDLVEDNGAGGDDFNTEISQIVFAEGAGVTLDEDLDQVIAGVSLFDGTNTITTDNPDGTTISINTDNITFANLSAASTPIGEVVDNTTKTYRLSVWFRTDIATTIDQEAFEFEVTNTEMTFENGSSTLAGAQSANSGNISIDVVSTQMILTHFAGSNDAATGGAGGDQILVANGVPFLTTVEAHDAQGNLDLNYNAGTATATPSTAFSAGTPTQNWSNGTVTWSDLEFNGGEPGVTITFGDDNGPGIGDVTTLSFNVSVATSVINEVAINYPENILYESFDAGTLDVTGDDEVQIAEFQIVDSGGDSQETELLGVTFNITNHENLAEIAIFNESNNLLDQATVSGASVAFSWGNNNLDAAEGATANFRIFATFKQGNGEITDNAQIALTITDTEARGGGRTQFINAAAGGATTSLPETDDNRIEVNATQWVQVYTNGYANPLASSTAYERDPGFSLEVEARDNNQNIDLDITGAVDFTFANGDVLSGVPSNFTAGTLSAEYVILNDVFPATTNNVTLDVSPTFPGLSPLVFTDVEVEDNSDPTVVDPFVDLEPNKDESAAQAVTELKITFSENVRAVSGNLVIRDFEDVTKVIETISVTNLSKTIIVDNVVTFILSSILDKGRTYFVTLPTNSFEDYGSNGWIGLSGAGSWSFTTANDAAPRIVGFDPVSTDPGSPNGTISRSTNITLTFDEPVEFGTGTITVAGDNGFVTENYDVSSVSPDRISGEETNVIVINPEFSFVSDELVTVSIPETAFRSVDDGTDFEETGTDAAPTDNIETVEFRTINTFDNDAPVIEAQVFTDFNTIAGTTVGGDATLSGENWTSSGDNSGGAGAGNSVGGSGNAAALPATPGSYIQSPAVTSADYMTFIYSANAGAVINVVDPSGPSTLTTLNVIENTNGFAEFYYEFGTPYTGNIRLEVDAASTSAIVIDEFSIDRGFSPHDGKGDVPHATGMLTITFNEPIQPGSGVIRLYAKTDPDITVLQFGASSGLLTYNGNELSIDISSLGNLPGSVPFYVGISENAIEDLSGNPFEGIDNKYTWNFTTANELIAPKVNTTTPEDNETNVSTTDHLELKFDEPVVAGASGTVTLYLSASGDIVEQWDVTTDILNTGVDGSLSLEGNTLTINPEFELSGLTGYNVRITAGAFEDYSGNAFAGILTANGWNFTTGNFDATAPAIDGSVTDSFVPAHAPGSKVVSINPTISFTMTEPVNGIGGANIIIYDVTNTQNHLALDATDFSIDYLGKTVKINNVALDYNTDYYIEIPENTIQDNSGNENSVAIGGIDAWEFTTILDTQKPSVESLNLAIDGTTNVRTSRTFVMEFDEPVQWGAGNINLYYTDADGSAVASLDVASDVNTVNEVPEDFDFDEGTFEFETGTWTQTNAALAGASLAEGGTGDAVSIASAQDDRLVSPMFSNIGAVAFSYRSADGTATQAQVYYSVDGSNLTTLLGTASSASTTFTSFNHTFVDAVDGYIIINRNVAGGANLVVDNFVYTSSTQLSFEFDLVSGGTDYYLTVDAGAITDVTTDTDNDFDGYAASPVSERWKFSTNDDATPPVLTAYSPSDDASIDVTSTDQISLTFGELVTPQIGSYLNIYHDDGNIALAYQIPVDSEDAMIVVNGSEITYTYDISDEILQELSGNTNYYFELEAGAFDDNESTPLSNIAFGTDGDSWDISTTGDLIAPAVEAITPIDDNFSVNPIITTAVTIDFAERVTASTGSLRVFLNSNDYEIATIPAVSASIDNGTISGSRVSFAIELSGNTNYYVTMDADAFRDPASNPSEAIIDNGAWNFRTSGETNAPIPSFIPNDEVTLVLPYNTLVGQFSIGETVTANAGGTADVIFDDGTQLFVNNVGGTINDTESLTGAAASAIVGVQYAPIIDVNDNLVIKFNEPVYTSIGKSITIADGPEGTIVIPITDAAQVSGGGTDELTINPTNPFHTSTTYTVTLPLGMVTDASSQQNALVDSWTFTTNEGVVIDNDVVAGTPPPYVTAPYTIPAMTTCLFGDVINLQEDIVIAELKVGDFADVSADDIDLVLTIDSNFEFEAGVGTAVNDNGTGDVTDVQIVVTNSTVTITYDTDGTLDELDAIRISGLRIKQVSNNVLSTGTITRTGGLADIYGFEVSHDLVVMDIDVESVDAPTILTDDNMNFCQDLDPDDIDGLGGVDEAGDFDLSLNAATNVVWYPEDGGNAGNPDYLNPIAGIVDPLDPSFAELLDLSYQTAGVYKLYATQTNANGCESDEFLEVSVQIYGLPDADDLAGADITDVCSSENIVLGKAGNAALTGYTFDWTANFAGDADPSDTANPSITAPINTDQTTFLTEDHTYSLTVTNNNSCVDIGVSVLTVTVDPRIDVSLNASSAIFSYVESENEFITLTGSMFAGDEGVFVGSGLGSIDIDNIDGGDGDGLTASAVFSTSNAGSGTHQITYTHTDGTTGCADQATLTYFITAASDIAAGQLLEEYCQDASTDPFDIDLSDLGTGDKTGWTYVGYQVSGDGSAIIEDTDPDGPLDLEFDPVAAWNDATIIPESDGSKIVNITRIVHNGSTNIADGFNQIIVQPLPTVSINNLDELYCIDGGDVVLDVTVINNGTTNSTPILGNQFYVAKETAPGSATYGTPEPFAGTTVNFATVAANGNVGLAGDTEANYRLSVITATGDDPFGTNANGNNLGCQQTTFADFTLYDSPVLPTLNPSASQVDFGGGLYEYEYCVDDVDALFENIVPVVPANTTIRWYTDDGSGNPDTEIITGSVNNMGRTNFENTDDLSVEGVYVFHFTQTNTFGNVGFVGCESAYSTVTFRTYDTPDTPTVDVSGDGEDFVTDRYVFEYCAGTLVSSIDILTPSVVTGTDFYDWYDTDKVTIIDGFGVGDENADDNIGDGLDEGIFAAAGNVSVSGLEFMTYFGEDDTPTTSGTYTLYFAKRENRNTNGIYDGCSSELVQVDVVVYDVPLAPTLSSALSDINACSGELSFNDRIAPTDNIETPLVADTRYTWYDNSSGGASIQDVDGADVSYNDVIPSLTPVQGTADINAGFYELANTYNALAHLSQTTNLLNRITTNFAGCESTARTAVDITIYPLDEIPVIVPPSLDAYVGGTNEVFKYATGELANDATLSAMNFVATTAYAGGLDQSFTWQFSDNSYVPGGEVSVADNASVEAVELLVSSIQTDKINYFVINQTTNIEAGVFDGCQSDYAEVAIQTFNEPAAPTTTEENLYYCAGVDNGGGNTVQNITVLTGEAVDATHQFRWYNTLANVSSGIVMFTGATATAADLVPDEKDDGNVTLTDLSGLLTNSGTYTFYVTQATDIDGTANPDFGRGSESDPILITVYVKSVPTAPVVLDTSPEICDEAINPTFQVAFTSGSRYTWMHDADDNAIPDDAKLVDEEFESSYTSLITTPGSYTYFVSQITDQGVNGSTFDGCESTYSSLVFTINDIPAPPTVTGNVVDNQSVYCADATIGDLVINNVGDYNGTATFNWYRNSNSTGLIANSVDPTTGASLAPDDNSNYPSVDRDTDEIVSYYVTTVEDGCESSENVVTNNTTVTLEINPLPDLTILYDALTGGNSANDNLNGTRICYDETLFTIQGTANGVDATSGTFEIYTSQTDADDETNPLTTTGFMDLNGANDGQATIDPAVVATDNGETREGASSTYYIRFDYTDGVTCNDYIVYAITIDSQPTLDIEYDAIALDDLGAAYEICYEEGTMILRGKQEGASAATGTWSVNTGNSSLSSTTGGNVTFNLQTAATNAGETEEGAPSDHIVTFTYSDGNACENSVSATIRVNPRPTLNIVYDAATGGNNESDDLDNSAVCFDQSVFTIQGIQEGIDATSGTWAIEHGGLTASTNGTATFNPRTAALSVDGVELSTDENTTHEVTFNYTDGNTCTNTYKGTIEVTKLPTLNIVVDTGDNDGGSEFCTSTELVGLQGQEDGSNVSTGLFTIDTGASSIENGGGAGGNGSAEFYPWVAQANLGLDSVAVSGNESSHIITFTYTNTSQNASCTNLVTTDGLGINIVVNPLPLMELFSDDLGGFTTSDDIVEFCESDTTYTLRGNRNTGNSGTRSMYHTYNGTTTSIGTFTVGTTGDDDVLFTPSDWTDDVKGQSGTFEIQYEYLDGNTGCYNQITKNMVVNILPEVFAVVNGGCIDPQVEFDVELLSDSWETEGLPEPPRDSPYTLDDLTFEWKFYNADDKGVIQKSSPYSDDPNDETQSVKSGQMVTHNFDGFDGLDAQFGVVLVATTKDTGCSNPEDQVGITERSILIRINPNIAIEWDQVIVDEPTTFYVNENELSLNQIKAIKILDETNNMLIIDEEWEEDEPGPRTSRSISSGADVPVFGPFDYAFTNAGKYDLKVILENTNGCLDSLLREVNIIPLEVVDPDAGFIETFDTSSGFDPDNSGWYAEKLIDDAIVTSQASLEGIESLRPSSWICDQIDLNADSLALDGTVNDDLIAANSENWAWGTLSQDGSSYHYLSAEDSWLYSPAFDFSQLDRPMLKLTMAFDFEESKDGAVVQYSTDRGESWLTLGNYSNGATTGLEWYNFDNVGSDPGQQQVEDTDLATSVGWSGTQSNPKWVSARHSLDDIPDADRLNVRFRFALGATSANKSGHFGFALADFTIQERSKNVLIEEFVSVSDEDTDGTSINTPTANLKDGIANELPGASVAVRDETIIAYHSDFGFADPFNAQNPAGPSARSIYYNVDRVTSILDGQLGGINSTAKAGDLTWDEDDLRLNSLKDPGFNITLTPDPTASDTEVKGTVSFTANQDYPANTEFRAYVVILEDIVTQSVGGIDEFDNVMRKMLPSGSGKYKKLETELGKGEALLFNGEEMKVSWNLSNISNDDNLSAIAFIQNSGTKEIYQSVKISKTNDFVKSKSGATVTDVEDEQLVAKDFSMYPNPSDHEVFIIFDQLIQENMKWSVFDQTGRVFEQGELSAGNEGFSLQTDRFPSGVYYMSIRGEKSEFEFKKLMITH